MLPPIDTSSILKLRQQILARNEALKGGVAAEATPETPRFGAALTDALRAVSAVQDQASAATNAWETGQTHDLASVMIARQKATIAFEATLQARNRLVGAYKDVMNMPL
ncbi:flagellar hook-basal body complex protein FliE [Sandarakinorhabdus oryzae]|uniref:flagellar hook-basal body complex protein FliE n=1 Tax=Sandarakinorhabdus oryzae TaxID=2675220 RepID=UPI0012E29CDE|nr:flagellar hook-basal body complex protein FliE [Sandarakinorhabdus oryzae]